MLILAVASTGLSAPAAGAGAVDVASWAGIGAQGYSAKQPIYAFSTGPTITADGSVVVGVLRSATALDIDRIVPGTNAVERLMTVPVLQQNHDPTLPGPHWVLGVSLTPAGDGFFVIEGTRETLNHCCYDTAVLTSRVTYFADAAGLGSEVPGLGGSYRYSSCFAVPRAAGAAGDADVLLLSKCDGVSVVRHLDGRPDTPVTLPWSPTHLAGDYVSGVGVDQAGGDVLDWRTGETVRSFTGGTRHVLLEDGTVLYTDSRTGVVQRLGQHDAEPTPLNVTGDVVAAAGGRLLTRTPEGGGTWRLRVWTLRGAYVAESPGFPDAVAFDGSRVVYAQQSCLTTRILTWPAEPPTPGVPGPVPLEAGCGRPLVAWPVDVRPSGAKVLLTCPAETSQGCMGDVALNRPGLSTPYVRTFVVRPGEHRWYRLTPRLGRARCERFARTRRWQISLSPRGGLTAFVPAQRRDHCHEG